MTRTRIVVADDHQEMRERVVQHLQDEFDVIGAVKDGNDVLEAEWRMRPDLIVLDISMPEMDGIEVAEQLRQRNSKTKIVFLTVHEDSDFLEAALDAGARGYVVKSRMTSDLIPAIHAAMDGRSFISTGLCFSTSGG